MNLLWIIAKVMAMTVRSRVSCFCSLSLVAPLQDGVAPMEGIGGHQYEACHCCPCLRDNYTPFHLFSFDAYMLYPVVQIAFACLSAAVSGLMLLLMPCPQH